jgi:cysteine desulfurase/selenocysteine lyase
MEAAGEIEVIAAGDLVDVDGEGEEGGDDAETGDDVGGWFGSVDGDRFGAAGVGEAVEETGQTGDVVGVAVGEADSAEAAKTPAEAAPGDLGAFAAVEEGELAVAADEETRQPAVGEGEHGTVAEEEEVDHSPRVPFARRSSKLTRRGWYATSSVLRGRPGAAPSGFDRGGESVGERSSGVAVRDLAVEVERLRAETPGCREVVHFNHAGSSLMPEVVVEAVVGFVRREAEIGGYEAADEAEERLQGVYGSIARLIGAEVEEIAVVENATRGWDMAFYAIPFRHGDRILTSMAEYASNVIAFLQVAERGVLVEVVPNDESGQIDVEALGRMLDERVRVVAISHMPTNGGLVQPAAAVGRLTREAGAIYVLDACQTVGQMPIDVEAIGCDVLSATSRKFLRGPRGMGFLYVRRGLIEELVPPLIDLHAARWTARDRYELRTDARRFENWECNVAGKLGMGVAIDYALDLGMEAIWARIAERAARLRARLGEIPGVRVRDLGEVRGGIVTFTVNGVAAKDVARALKERSINVVTSSVFSTRYDMEARGLSEMVRASVHYLTTDEEIEVLFEVVSGQALGVRR